MELLISILQHPLRARAPATTDKQHDSAATTAPDLPADPNSHRPQQPPATSPHSTSPTISRAEPPTSQESAEATDQSGKVSDPSMGNTLPVSPANGTGKFTHPLGILPHTLRGFLSTFTNVPLIGHPYDCCSACSPRILEAYEKDGWDFVKRALGEKGYVEELSGLAEVQKRAEEAMAGMDIEDEEDSEALEEEGELV